MTFNYYLAWLHFDSRGRMSTRLPEGHRVLEILHNSGSNRHPPALWVLVEAVVTTPSYTPAHGNPMVTEAMTEYRQPEQQSPRPSPYPPSPPSGPVPVPYTTSSGPHDFREQHTEPYDFREHADTGHDFREDAGQQGNGRTQYPEPSPSLEVRDDDYRQNYVPGIPMSPARRI
jgi:hypothetical protein